MESFKVSGAAKRRRLTLADGGKVKNDGSAEQEAGPERPEKGMSKMETHDLWMQFKWQTEEIELHIHRLAGCDRQESVRAEEAEEPSLKRMEVADSVKATNETGAEQEIMLSSADATQGVEVFESVGVPNEKAMPRDEQIKRSRDATAAEHFLPLAVEQKAAQVKRYKLAKQSGVGPVNWNTRRFAWVVHLPKVDSKGTKIGWTTREFAVKKFMVLGQTEAEADAAALEAAKAFHAELVEKGILREPTLKDPNLTSEVPGVSWKKNLEKWVVEVQLQVHMKKRKRIYGGLFTEKAAAEAKALELREKHGLQLQVKPVPTLANRYAGLPVFHPKVPYPGVQWNVPEQKWHAKCRVGGAFRNFRVQPKDHSEAELERSFKVAAAWKKKKDKEKKGKAVKPKAKPPKK